MQLDINKKYLWRDSSMDKIVIEYNDILVELDTDDGIKKLIFKNYIAIDYIGQWDENIVDCIYEENDHDLIERALEKVSMNNDVTRMGGGTRNINSNWKCIVIRLIDGVCIRIVCSEVDLEV